MIEGLKVTVKGAELRALCIKQADHHAERSAYYTAKVENMEPDDLHSSNQPRRTSSDKARNHSKADLEMRFIADHLKLEEDYLLDSNDMAHLGISVNRYLV